MAFVEPSEVTINPNQPPMLSGPLLSKILQCEKKIIIIQGGGDAAKTITILQALAIHCIRQKNLHVTTVGVDIPNLKRGAMRAFRKYVASDPQISPYLDATSPFNKTDREYLFTTRSMLSFTSFEDPDDARGSENDYVFMNEANLNTYNLFWELQRKCRKQIIIDYNPTFAFWAHSKLINGGEKQFEGQVQLFIVDHRHNPFLTQAEHDAYENISDPERFRVYARGLTGQVKGAIFRFKKADMLPKSWGTDDKGNEIEVPLPFGFGVDIGYTTDKTAIVKVYMNGKDHYYQELLYMSNDEIQNLINEKALLDTAGNAQTVEGYIADILIKNGCTASSIVWGDHDKNMSVKLRHKRIPYRMAKKGPNSVTASISSVKRYQGFILHGPNIEEEQKTYIWETAVDILTGNEISTGKPIDGVADHLLAAIRYFEHSYSMRYAG